jgi:hypothetical protein
VYAKNNPTKYIDPSGLAVTVYFLNTTGLVPQSTQTTSGLANILSNAAPGSIIGIDLEGHGLGTTAGFNPNDPNWPDQLRLDPWGNVWLENDNQEWNLVSLLQGKFAPGARFTLNSCFSAHNGGIALALAVALPGLTTIGNTGEINDLFGITWQTSGSQSATYQTYGPPSPVPTSSASH